MKSTNLLVTEIDEKHEDIDAINAFDKNEITSSVSKERSNDISKSAYRGRPVLTATP